MTSNDKDCTAVVSVEAESVELSDARRKEIEDEVKACPLTSEVKELCALESQYKSIGSSSFLAGLRALQEDYNKIRTVRGDGNCYYRSFLYSLCENLFHDKSESQRILNFVKTESWEIIKKAGYDEYIVDVFYEETFGLMEKVVSGSISPDDFHKLMNEENSCSNDCTWYLRVVTATHLKQDPERFLPFIEQPGVSVEQFCRSEVEPMGKDCEQLQVLALAEAFGVQVQIEYLDGHDLVNGKVVSHIFGPDKALTKLTLLYRPGHYDILYQK
jgi:ubiquitin thioesterase protein OTUB1